MPAAVALLILATSIALLAVVVAAITIAIRSRVVPGPSLVAKTVIVNTKKPDDQSIRGILAAQHADRITLAQAVYLYRSGDQEIGGLVHIPIGAVAFIQEIEATA